MTSSISDKLRIPSVPIVGEEYMIYSNGTGKFIVVTNTKKPKKWRSLTRIIVINSECYS